METNTPPEDYYEEARKEREKNIKEVMAEKDEFYKMQVKHRNYLKFGIIEQKIY